jgi:hypothetical protein
MKKLLLNLIIVRSILSLISPLPIFAQELEAKVTVNMEKLQPAQREILDNFVLNIENYLNLTKFSRQNWDAPKIKCSFTILLESATMDNTYSAQIIVASQRSLYNQKNKYTPILNILDNNWQFKYERNKTLYYDPGVFDSFTSLLNYYALIIIGYDEDSYNALAGSPYFNEALKIASLGSNSSYSRGWERFSSGFSRLLFVEELLSEKFKQFREDFFNYHYNGLDVILESPNQAKEQAFRLVVNLAKSESKLDFRSPVIKVFFDAKHNEIISLLKGYASNEIFGTLKKIDPQRIGKYDEAMNN